MTVSVRSLPTHIDAVEQELYTLDGAGTLIARDLYDGIRLAGPSDVSAIIELITPLEVCDGVPMHAYLNFS